MFLPSMLWNELPFIGKGLLFSQNKVIAHLSSYFPLSMRLHGRRHSVGCIYLPGVKYRMFRNGGASAAVTGFGVRARE